MAQQLELKNFAIEDFSEYKSWFSDPDLNKALGPMDDEWLKYAVGRTDHQEVSLFEKQKLAVVAGIHLPDVDHPDFYITDLAVKPALRSLGIGSKALTQIIEYFSKQPNQGWQTSVSIHNPSARAFFEKNGWHIVSEIPSSSGMIDMTFRQI